MGSWPQDQIEHQARGSLQRTENCQMNIENPRRLGRGLEALIPAAARPAASAPPAGSEAEPSGAREVRRILIEEIVPNPFQPRKEFRPEELRELEESLKRTGLLQPITVRPSPSGKGFELAAGERRLRAATNLGWTDIPATVRTLNDQELLAVALVENLQRADLNPIEEAQGYSRLMNEFGLTQQSVSERVGKERSTVANMLRILQLPSSIQTMLASDSISLGHARALLSIDSESEQLVMAKEVIAQGLSVREVERRARDRKPTPKVMSEKRTVAQPTSDSNVKRIEDQLRKRLQTDVKINLFGTDKGTVAISFYNSEDLERLLDLVLGSTRERH